MTRLPIRRPYLALLLLCAACSDEELTEPVTAAPNAYIMPNTDESCGTACLRDDIVGNWAVSLHPASGTYLTLADAKGPTTGGERVEATYCIYRTSDDYLYGCTQPASWFTSYAYRPDGHVIIEGRDVQGYARVRFTGQAPTPEVQLLEYERPAVANCGGFYCSGFYRLKIAIRNTGWYGSDRIYISGEDATGSRWPLSDAGASVSDETAQWTWTQVHPGYPGSRIVASYHPWGSTLDDVIEFSVPLRDDSPTLTLDAMEAPSFTPEAGGPLAIQVQSGTPVLFTPFAPGSLIEREVWEWIPADTSKVATVPGECGQESNECQTPVYEDGTMRITARVDGQMREATAPVGMAPPQLIVDCDDSVVRGSQVTCTARVEPALPFRFVRWTGQGQGFRSLQPVGQDRSAGYTETWAGPAVTRTDVTAEVIVGSHRLTSGNSFEVLARTDWQPLQVPSPPVHFRAPYLGIPVYPTRGLRIGIFLLGEPVVADTIPVDVGPNKDLVFLQRISSLENFGIVAHKALNDPNHAWHVDQNGFPAGTCNNSVVTPYRNEVLRHEGAGPTPPSHWHIANQLLVSLAPHLKLEGLFARSGKALEDAVTATWVDFSRSEEYQAPHRAHDANDDPEAALPCTLDFNRGDA